MIETTSSVANNPSAEEQARRRPLIVSTLYSSDPALATAPELSPRPTDLEDTA
jgi:hypothetical protein